MDNFYDLNLESGGSSKYDNMSFTEILNAPVPIAIAALARKGYRAAKSIRQTTREVFQSIADNEYMEMCRPILTLEECVRWIRIQQQSFPQIAYLFIYVENNPRPRNENDMLSIAVAGVDAEKHAIPIYAATTSRLFPTNQPAGRQSPNSSDIVCVVLPARTIDSQLVRALNGTSSVLMKL